MSALVTLFDLKHQLCLSVNRTACMLRSESEGVIKDYRLRALHASLLGALFSAHPKPLVYKEIEQILSQHGLHCPDIPRLHRKMSELRQALGILNVIYKDLVHNVRGVGYALPLHLHPLSFDVVEDSPLPQPEINRTFLLIRRLLDQSIQLHSTLRIIKQDSVYVIDRASHRDEISAMLQAYDKAVGEILRILSAHPAEFVMVRLTYTLAQLRTYIGMARISAYPITHTQWQEWLGQEINQLYQDARRLCQEIYVSKHN